MRETGILELTAEIVSAHVANNTVAVGDVPDLVRKVHDALSAVGNMKSGVSEAQAKVPVVSVRASVKPDYIVCMECGRKQSMLKRHLQTAHGMTPEQYRRDFGLPDSYPLVATNYAQKRRELAKSMGLGSKGRNSTKGRVTRSAK